MNRGGLVQITRPRLLRGCIRVLSPLSSLNFPGSRISMLRFTTCPPLPLAYTMSNTTVIWLRYESYNSRHGDHPGIHRRDRNASAVREGMGDPTSSTSRWTSWRYGLQNNPVLRWKPVNLNTKLPWPDSWMLAKVYLRPDSGK